jgi:uncharacterized membrane protein YhfC
MVVAPLTLTCLVLSTLFAAALPIVLYRRLRVPLGLNARDAIAGIAVFALFASVIERALNGYVLHQNAAVAAWLSHPLTFVIYGALAAGVCEEVGRFIAMKMMWQRAVAAKAAAAPNSLANSASEASVANAAVGSSTTSRPSVSARVSMRKKTVVPPSTGDSTALGYGIGHGGAEAWIVGVLVQIQWIVFAVVANRGELDSYLGSLPDESLMRIQMVLASLSPLTAGVFLLERVAAPSSHTRWSACLLRCSRWESFRFTPWMACMRCWRSSWRLCLSKCSSVRHVLPELLRQLSGEFLTFGLQTWKPTNTSARAPTWKNWRASSATCFPSRRSSSNVRPRMARRPWRSTGSRCALAQRRAALR